MAKYESTLVFSVKESEDKAKALVEKFKSYIEKSGTVENVDEWGKRRLAYPINYENEGYYVVFQHENEPSFVAEFTRKLNIADGVLRYLTVAREEE